MGDPYEKEGARRRHAPVWRWNDELDWWELPNSDRADCICAQYVLYKLLGLVPDPDLVIEEVDLEVSDPSFLEWLEENGFRPAEGGPRTEGAPPQCGCGDGRQTACVVLYRDSQGGAPIHVAAFDAKLCDWGGKLSGPGGIVRFCDPEDYLNRLAAEERGAVEMVFYCKDEAGPYVSDEAINRGLNRVADDESADDEPVPDDFGLFPLLRRWLGWVLGGLLLVMLLRWLLS